MSESSETAHKADELLKKIRASERHEGAPELAELIESFRKSTTATAELSPEADEKEYRIPAGLRTALLRDRTIEHGWQDSHKEVIVVEWQGNLYEVTGRDGNYSISKKDPYEQRDIEYDSADARFLDRIFSQDIPEHVMAAFAKSGKRSTLDGHRVIEVTLENRTYYLEESGEPYHNGYLRVSVADTDQQIESLPLYEDADVSFMEAMFLLTEGDEEDDFFS